PPIWIGATTDRAIKRAGRIGDAFMAAPNVTDQDARRQFGLFSNARAEAGVQPAGDAGRMLEVYCHADAAEAHRRAGPHLLTKYAAYAAWGLTGSAGAAASAASTATGDHAFVELARNRFVIGNPDDVVAGLLRQHREVGITHLAMRVAWPGSDPAHALECIDLIGRDVLPVLRNELENNHG
ncbi:MAG: LLM class flavin-dependent oxidoreductase, partial [Actinomycetota bacterium]|nr:LLM class flavin-dependent oxidoreductase [Actinomycetota bacterium]